MRKTRRGGKRMSVQLPELQTVILRLARQRGMQAADAGDVAQAVLAAVAKPVERREHDPEREIPHLAASRGLERPGQMCYPKRSIGRV